MKFLNVFAMFRFFLLGSHCSCPKGVILPFFYLYYYLHVMYMVYKLLISCCVCIMCVCAGERAACTVQSSYNFTNSRVATHFHAWLHAKICREPRLVAACPTPRPRMVTRKELPCATLSSCVSHAMSTRGCTQKAACAMLNSCMSHVYGCSHVVLATRLHL